MITDVIHCSTCGKAPTRGRSFNGYDTCGRCRWRAASKEVTTPIMCVFCKRRGTREEIPQYSRTRYAHPFCLSLCHAPEKMTEADAFALVKLNPEWLIWARVEKGTPDACWPWRGDRDPRAGSGYGRLTVGSTIGRRFVVSRLVYMLEHGLLPPDVVVRHSCDNPPCCNPGHLLEGSQAANIQDAVDRGRMHYGDAHGLRKHPEAAARGEHHGAHILTEEQVLAIRVIGASRAPGRRSRPTFREIGERFGVSATAAADAFYRRRWAHIK